MTKSRERKIPCEGCKLGEVAYILEEIITIPSEHREFHRTYTCSHGKENCSVLETYRRLYTQGKKIQGFSKQVREKIEALEIFVGKPAD